MKPIRVGTFNLLAPMPFLPSWQRRVRSAGRMLAAAELDLLGTQEGTPETLAALGEHLLGHERVGQGRGHEGRGIQCAIFFRSDRFRLVDWGHFWLSRTPSKPGSRSWLMGSCRVATWVRLEDQHSGRSLSWINVHLSHLSRRAQARLIRERISRLPGPRLLTGDFNGTPWPWWSSHRVLTRDGLLVDAWERARSRGRAGGTWHGYTGLPLARIGWVLCSPPLEVREARVLRSPAGEVLPSDHHPVMAELGWPVAR